MIKLIFNRQFWFNYAKATGRKIGAQNSLSRLDFTQINKTTTGFRGFFNFSKTKYKLARLRCVRKSN